MPNPTIAPAAASRGLEPRATALTRAPAFTPPQKIFFARNSLIPLPAHPNRRPPPPPFPLPPCATFKLQKALVVEISCRDSRQQRLFPF